MNCYSLLKSFRASFVASMLVGLLVLEAILPLTVLATEEIAADQPSVEIELATTDNTGDDSQLEIETILDLEDDIAPSDDLGAEDESDTLPDVPVSGDPEIDTGDATAGAQLESHINTNDITTDAEPPETEASPELNEPVEKTLNGEPLLTPPAEDVDIDITNTAHTTNDAELTANTGDNIAAGETVSIETGDAVAYVDVLNVVNTNVVDSEGLVTFINETLGYEDFDLRDEFALTYPTFDTAVSTPSGGTQTTLTTSNTASIENNIVVTANSGGNEAVGDDVSITTGDAYASANIINVANTNIVDSNYLLLVFNNFDNYAGDIVLPNSSFFNNLMNANGGVSGVSTDITNTSNLSNNVETIANSGDNELYSNSGGSIDTGSAYANGSVLNNVNETVIGGTSFSMLIRVQGSWSGSINGLPDGFYWRETPDGIEIFSTPAGGSGPSLSGDSHTITNNATINNNVKVYALSGNNKIDAEDGSIETGSAYADSSIINIANTNVISSNWSKLIFTIYGNWSGDLSFGQPDLWLGVSAESPDSPIMPGSLVTYTYTVFNRGDTIAPNVTLRSRHETNALNFDKSGAKSSEGNNTDVRWELGNIAAGETREFTHSAVVSEALNPSIVSAIPLTSVVSSTQKDGDPSDNEDIVTIHVGQKRSESSSSKTTFPAHFDIVKTASQEYAQPGDTVDYTITLFNRGGQLFDALLVDVLEDNDGKVVLEQSWPLGEVKNWETITVKYSYTLNNDATSGTLINNAQLVGFHGSKIKSRQAPYQSPIATHRLTIGEPPDGRVLGLSTSQCPAYLNEYLRYGASNSPSEVTKLQAFLSKHLSRSLTVSGVFDLATEQAVRDFQLRYRDDILTPWGLTRDSGYVYYTTQKKINELVCGEARTFPLDRSQELEISAFRQQHTRRGPFTFASQSAGPAITNTQKWEIR